MGDLIEEHTVPTVDNNFLPVPNPTLSYWREQLHRLDSYRSSPELPISCDVLIIGAGLAGVSVAYHLSKTASPPSVVLLEARQTCSGATGRNGGHVKVQTATLLAHTKNFGVVAAEELGQFVWAQSYALKETVEKEDIDCEFELRRSYDVFINELEAEEMRSAWKECLDKGDDWTREVSWVGKQFAENVTSVKGAKGAFSLPVSSFWPYKFVTGLLESAMRKNSQLNLQTETPVLRVENGDEVTVVHTPRGTIKARKVVFATNAYTAGLLPEFSRVITPYKGTCTHLTGLGDAEPVSPHIGQTYNIEFGLKGVESVDYLNPRPDGGIVVGGGKWTYENQRELWYNTVDDSTLIEPAIRSKYFEGYMQKNFKGWKDSHSRIEKIWTGIQGSTPDGMPHIGKVPGRQNQWILAGFNGGGNGMVFLSAKGVAKMVMENVTFEETGVGIPALFKTTKERLTKATCHASVGMAHRALAMLSLC